MSAVMDSRQPEDAHRLPAADARQRLAASRSQLVRHMSGDPRREPAGQDSGQPLAELEEQDINRLTSSTGTWQLVKLGLSSWWRHHPANIAVAVATPLLHRYAERKPFQLLAIAAGAGAALVVLKPWRLISVGSLALATLRSSEFSGLISSLLTSGDDKDNSSDNT